MSRFPAQPSGPRSPCINVCVLDAEGVCRGCSRTIEEIAGWGRMSAAEQWAVVTRLERLGRAAGPITAPGD